MFGSYQELMDCRRNERRFFDFDEEERDILDRACRGERIFSDVYPSRPVSSGYFKDNDRPYRYEVKKKVYEGYRQRLRFLDTWPEVEKPKVEPAANNSVEFNNNPDDYAEFCSGLAKQRIVMARMIIARQNGDIERLRLTIDADMALLRK